MRHFVRLLIRSNRNPIESQRLQVSCRLPITYFAQLIAGPSSLQCLTAGFSFARTLALA